MPHRSPLVKSKFGLSLIFIYEQLNAIAIDAASSGLHMRRSFAYSSIGSALMPRRAGKMRYEAGQFEEVRDAQERASITHRNLRIRCDHVCPLRRHGANGRFINLQQEPLAIAVVALANAGELPSAEWVERVGDAHKACRRDRNVCIPY